VQTLRSIEEVINQQCGCRRAFLTGHGSTAIYLALKAIESVAGSGEVIIPTLCCPSLAQVAIYAGFKPVFADVRRDDFVLDETTFSARISPQTRAIMPVHLFGNAVPMRPLLEVARERGIFVIEDAAQSLGGSYEGRPMGGWGDFGILSFGGTKIVQAGAGGALLTQRDEWLPIIEKEMACLPPFARSTPLALRALSHRNLYHACVDLLRTDPSLDVHQIFSEALPLYRDLYLHAFPEDPTIMAKVASGFQNLDAENGERVQRAEQYHAQLEGCQGLTLCSAWRSSRVVWRYALIIHDSEKLLLVTERLRRNGIHASNHYWSVADLMCGEKALPDTQYLCPRILNLWVDRVADKPYIERCCRIIRDCLETPGDEGSLSS